MRALLPALLWPGLLAAQEFVTAPDLLDDTAFYRAIACAAPPGGACRKPLLRWPEAKRSDLTVALATLSPGLPPDLRTLYRTGLTAALAQIDGAAAGVHLRQVDGPGADIVIHIVATPPGHVMRDTGVAALDGAVLPLGRVALRARAAEIRSALIAISAHTPRAAIASLLLEELTQSLGLMADIRGPAYRHSLFSEDGNSVTRLEGQDAMALRRHYDTRTVEPGVTEPEKEG